MDLLECWITPERSYIKNQGKTEKEHSIIATTNDHPPGRREQGGRGAAGRGNTDPSAFIRQTTEIYPLEFAVSSKFSRRKKIDAYLRRLFF
jgi:hypothetical protein